MYNEEWNRIEMEKAKVLKSIKLMKNFQERLGTSRPPTLNSSRRAKDRGATCCGGIHAHLHETDDPDHHQCGEHVVDL